MVARGGGDRSGERRSDKSSERYNRLRLLVDAGDLHTDDGAVHDDLIIARPLFFLLVVRELGVFEGLWARRHDEYTQDKTDKTDKTDRHTFFETLISCGPARTLTLSLSMLSTFASSTSPTNGRNTSALYLSVNTASASNGSICKTIRGSASEHAASRRGCRRWYTKGCLGSANGHGVGENEEKEKKKEKERKRKHTFPTETISGSLMHVMCPKSP